MAAAPLVRRPRSSTPSRPSGTGGDPRESGGRTVSTRVHHLRRLRASSTLGEARRGGGRGGTDTVAQPFVHPLDAGPDGPAAVAGTAPSTAPAAPVRREVLHRLRAAEGGGYVFMSDHSVASDVSGQTYDQIVKLVRQYGTYPLNLPEA